MRGPGRGCLMIIGSGEEEEDGSAGNGGSRATYAESWDSEWPTRRAVRKLEGVYSIGPIFIFSSSLRPVA